ncbi:major facilitator superfamily transporter [Colletotrichum graminicola]|nr:major facilitator superfamily transporter [Colletotrichum graminicola]
MLTELRSNRPGEHRQRQCLWPLRGPGPHRHPLQQRPRRLLCALRPLRDPFQHPPQEVQAPCLAQHQHVRLRPCHPAPGFRAELRRPVHDALLPGCFRDGHVPGRYALPSDRIHNRIIMVPFYLRATADCSFPVAFYLIGMWYRRNEAQRRYSFFFNSTTLAGAFGGLLAAAIGKMNGINGYSGWRYIFILEGALTAVVAIFLFFCLPDFPEDVKWLTEDEKAFVSARLRADQGNPAAERNITLRDVGRVFKDYKVILGGLMYFGLVVTAYGYAYFAPGIFQTYGYGPIQTQLHSVPPWVVAFVLSMTFAFFSDRTRHRFGFAIAAICVAIVGYGILISIHDNTPVQTFGLYAVASGSYTAMPIIVCWFNMNLGGHHRRSIGSGWQVGFGNIGGIVAVFAFLKKDAPRFIPGYSISISFAIVSVLCCLAYAAACWSANKERDRTAGESMLTEEEKTELGDLSPDYRYLL